jgi:hypothetical protein
VNPKFFTQPRGEPAEGADELAVELLAFDDKFLEALGVGNALMELSALVRLDLLGQRFIRLDGIGKQGQEQPVGLGELGGRPNRTQALCRRSQGLASCPRKVFLNRFPCRSSRCVVELAGASAVKQDIGVTEEFAVLAVHGFKAIPAT